MLIPISSNPAIVVVLSTFSTELTYERAVINPYDGRKRNAEPNH